LDAGPWEGYAAYTAGPWKDYTPAPPARPIAGNAIGGAVGGFDYAGAKAAGYSDAEIKDFLANQPARNGAIAGGGSGGWRADPVILSDAQVGLGPNATPDLSRLTDAQLGALKMVGGDLKKLPPKMQQNIQATLNSATSQGTGDGWNVVSQDPLPQGWKLDPVVGAPPNSAAAGRAALERSGDPRFAPAPSARTTYNPEGPRPTWQDDAKSLAKDVVETVNPGINIAGTQFVKGLNGLIGLPNTLMDLGSRGMATLMGHGADWTPPPHVMPTAEGMNKFIFGRLGLPEYNTPSIPFSPAPGGPQFDLGKAVDAGLQAVPTFGGGGVGAIPGALGGATSELAGQATADTPYELPARILGGSAGYRIGAKAVTPLPAKLTPNEQRAVQIADQNGVPLSVSQRTGSGQMLETIAGRFPTGHGPFERLSEKQAVAADRAALKQAGVDGERTDPESMKDVWKQASNNFELAKNGVGTVTLKPDFYNEAGKAAGDYASVTAKNAISPVVQKTFDDFFDSRLMKGGPHPQLSAQEYQSYRKNIGDTMDNLNPGSGEYRALKRMKNALDDAMVASAPSDKAEAIAKARREWANVKILNKAAAGGSVASRSAGNLAPSALTTALKSEQGADKFARTTGGLNDIATMKQYLADTFPNSGTPTVQAGHAMMGGGATLVGEHGASILHDPKMMAAAAALLGGPRAIANAVTGQGKVISPLVYRYLVNQAMVRANPGLYSARGMRSVPFSLAPGVAVAAPRLLEDQR
jgi:hypothetical protein